MSFRDGARGIPVFSMPRLLEPLWLILVTLGEKQLAQTIEYLREENRILRSKLPTGSR